MYYQIKMIMDKNKYEEKPEVVVISHIAGETYVTVNFGIVETKDGHEAHSMTLTGEKTAEDILKSLVLYGMLQEMTTAEFLKVMDALLCDDRLVLLKGFVGKQIELYDHSDKVNALTIGGKQIWLDKATRVGLANSVSVERAAGKTHTTMWFSGVKYTLPVDDALQMLSALELYALQCYNVTAEHVARIASMEKEEEVSAFDYKEGYPEQLMFNI